MLAQSLLLAALAGQFAAAQTTAPTGRAVGLPSYPGIVAKVCGSTTRILPDGAACDADLSGLGRYPGLTVLVCDSTTRILPAGSNCSAVPTIYKRGANPYPMLQSKMCLGSPQLLAPGEPCHTHPIRWCPLRGCDYTAKIDHPVKKMSGKRAVVGEILDLDDPNVGIEDEKDGIEARDATPDPYPMLQSKMCLGSPQLLAPGEPYHTHPIRWCPLQACDYTAKTDRWVNKIIGTRDDTAAAAQDYETELAAGDAIEITREDLQKRDPGLLDVSKVAGSVASLKANFAKGHKHAA
ncbi:hypothetical protein LTR16_004025 [Cryomyces antarcticus]|uniref:Uncharacterized protein n=1 Tax=Cryomyces antarcticus TaxID=329879 RepID=A0ABR0KS41_9PEZI|nr:hypothetical protein LTR16_004025 [Cryomyces antarcticus]